VDDVKGKLPDGTFDNNPCSVSPTQPRGVSQYDNVSPDPVACDAAPKTRGMDGQGNAIYDFRSVPAIKFRNRTLELTVVDPYRSCELPPPPGSPEGTPPLLVNVPFAFTGYQLDFGVKAGYFGTFDAIGRPVTFILLAGQGSASPVKVVRGPTESIWVIDNGDFLSSSVLQPSTRGRVYRIESVVPANKPNMLQ
jgi:hypothetical protein